nr:hypothetical protein CFP56_70574 [Quercus suber]
MIMYHHRGSRIEPDFGGGHTWIDTTLAGWPPATNDHDDDEACSGSSPGRYHAFSCQSHHVTTVLKSAPARSGQRVVAGGRWSTRDPILPSTDFDQLESSHPA